ncbi:glycosyl transferase [Candidatus Bathyarchaeota archaeon]|nr:MAG: glycosyl transferase [Candidatus Bathyarchaeota archaeon]
MNTLLTSAYYKKDEVTKNSIISLLEKNGVQDLEALKSSDVTEKNLIFVLRQKKYKINENFFIDLANLMDIPYTKKFIQKNKCVSALPYRFLKENLIVPMEINTTIARFATANPLNSAGLTVLEETFNDKKVEYHIGSIDTIEEVIENVYKEIHINSANWDLYDRNPGDSAYNVLVPWQKNLILCALFAFLGLFILSYQTSLIFIFTFTNFFYTLLNPFRFYVAFKGIQNKKLTTYVSEEDVKNLEAKELPVYTILVPVYKEAKVLLQIMENIYKMDYPKDKLDIKILFEEDDEETLREARKLGLFGITKAKTAQHRNFLKIFDPIIIPKGEIKTKPRACNYGLLRAKGEYVVIFDAEDDPEPDQLKKAIIAFQSIRQDRACFQSHLIFYNSKENLLTRWFSLEYQYRYDYYLEGLSAINAPIPLGGTSNHFRTKQLLELGSWDPHNVTEDADLGMRICKKGLETGMLNSYTYEEANPKLGSWIRQRSRWCKGHIQTYLVHMRNPLNLLKKIGYKKFLLFQLTFGGNIFLPLINPLLWAISILSILFPEMFNFLLFAEWITLISTMNLICGNLFQILLYLTPVFAEKKYSFIPFAFTIPFYWILVSAGAWKGLIQLITKPHYWEKTMHGISKYDRSSKKIGKSIL